MTPPTRAQFVCTICGYPGLREPPRTASGGGSYEICPSCGFQFGVDDDDRRISPDCHRERWIQGGMQWSSRGISKPPEWNPREQLELLKHSTTTGPTPNPPMYSPDPTASESTTRAAGGLVWRASARGPELLLIRRFRHGVDEWSLPKGKLDPGESFAQAALREVKEETGVRARLGRFAGVMQYRVNGGNKVVCFWEMTQEGMGQPLDTDEVAEIRWVTRDEALEMLSHEQNRELVRHVPVPAP